MMKNKYIAFTGIGKAELLEESLPQPNVGQVVVRTAVSTISSGTERANLSGNPNVSIARGALDMSHYFPRRLGYSSSGVIESVGDGVSELKVGDRVAVWAGTHSRYQLRSVGNVQKLPDEISFSDGALAYIGTFPLAAIRKCHVEIGESAVVMGQGVLGQIAVQLLRASGAVPIIAVDPDEAKREKALRLGADYAFNPFDSDFEKKVRDVTFGGVNVAIEVTGNGTALNQVLDCMARFGRVALLGCTRESDFTVDYYKKVHGPGISLIGAHNNARPNSESSAGLWTTFDDIRALMQLTKCGRLSMSSIVEEVHAPNEAPAVFGRLMVEKAFPVVQFDWNLLEV